MEGLAQAIPELDVVIGEKTYRVRCSFGLLARFEQATKKNPLDGSVWENPSPMDLATLLWAGIVPLEPGITVDMVSENLAVSQVGQVKDLVIALMSNAAIQEKKA